jgi:hypothetical protein
VDRRHETEDVELRSNGTFHKVIALNGSLDVI